MEDIKSNFVDMKTLKKYLSVSGGKVYDLMNNDKLPYYKFGKKFYFRLVEIDEFFATKKQQ